MSSLDNKHKCTEIINKIKLQEESIIKIDGINIKSQSIKMQGISFIRKEANLFQNKNKVKNINYKFSSIFKTFNNVPIINCWNFWL